METDPSFYALFKRHPRAFLRLAGLPDEGEWLMDSITLKSNEKRVDGVFVRQDAPGPLILAEFQGYDDPRIYYRALRELMMYLELCKTVPETCLVVVLFLHESLDPGFEMLDLRSPHRLLRLYLPECLERMRGTPGPWIVLEPLVLKSVDEARALAPVWRAQLESLKLSESESIFLMGRLLDLVVERFPSLKKEEVRAMFQLTPLKETRYYKELTEEYREKFMKEGLQEGQKIGRQVGLQEGRQVGLQEGRQEGEEIGMWIGRVQAYQALLGLEMGTKETLAAKSVTTLKRMATRLEKQVRAQR